MQDPARNLGTLAADQSALRVELERLGLDQGELSLALEAGVAAREPLDEQDSALAQRLAELDQRSGDALAAGLATRAERAQVEELRAALQSSQTQVAGLQERLGTSEQRARNAEEQVIGLVDLLLMLEERLAALEADD